MTFHFIATQDLDGPFEFLVHIFRGFRFRISSGAKSVINGLQRTVKEIVRTELESDPNSVSLPSQLGIRIRSLLVRLDKSSAKRN